MIGVYKIGDIRRAYFEHHHPIKEICGSVNRSSGPHFRHACAPSRLNCYVIDSETPPAFWGCVLVTRCTFRRTPSGISPREALGARWMIELRIGANGQQTAAKVANGASDDRTLQSLPKLADDYVDDYLESRSATKNARTRAETRARM